MKNKKFLRMQLNFFHHVGNCSQVNFCAQACLKMVVARVADCRDHESEGVPRNYEIIL